MADPPLTPFAKLKPPKGWEAYRGRGSKRLGRVLKAYEQLYDFAIARGEGKLAQSIMRDRASLARRLAELAQHQLLRQADMTPERRAALTRLAHYLATLGADGPLN